MNLPLRGWLAVCSLLAYSLADGQVIESIDVIRTTTHIDVVALFNCHARYVTHDPSSEADSVRVRLSLAEDCGSEAALRSESVAVGVQQDLLHSMEIVPLLARDVEVIVQWRRAERFVVLPTADQQGLRLRLLRPGREAASSKVVISEPAGDLTTAFAINLESAVDPFDAAALDAAARRLALPAYTSTMTIDEVQWYRLRVGPIATREAAERALLEAQRLYPRAWLAIADETIVERPGETSPELPAAASTAQPTIRNSGAEETLAAARTRLRKKDYDAAIELLTKYLAAPNEKHAEARELLGLARERNGQLAHAKAEYEAYLREYPTHASAARVRRRLHALRTAQLEGRTGRTTDTLDELGWRSFGGIAQTYRRDNNEITTQRTSNDFIGQNALLTDIDAVVRRRGFDYDFAARLNAGYAKDLLSDGPGDRVRVSSAFVELAGRDHGWSTRLGRQSRAAGGVLGVFDGAYGNYQLLPHLTLDAAVGFPVESTREAPETGRMFEALALGFGVFAEAWEPGIYVVNQTYDGLTDRQAIGAELRYFRPGRVLIGFADYDVHFQALNSAVLIGTLQLPARWMLNVDIERRQSPMLTTRNSLIGQSVQTLDELLDVFSEDQIRELALDRTSQTEVYGITLSRPFAERLQFTLNAASILAGPTDPSGGVEGIPSLGRELVLSMQLLAASLMRTGDLTAFGVRRQSGGAIESMSLGVSSRIPLWRAWRIVPQLRVDKRTFELDGSSQWIYAPSLRLALQGQRLLFEIEGGGEKASRELEGDRESITRYYVSVGYRWSF